MSLEDYLKQNIKSDILNETIKFTNSPSYANIKNYSLSSKNQLAKQKLKLRDKKIHQTILSDIQRLQDKILVG